MRNRIRKVKCDELKPRCARCTSTGRRCEGYVDPAPIKRRALRTTQHGCSPGKFLPLYTSGPCSDFLDRPDEGRAFQYFQTRAVQVMSGYFEVAFWNELVLQVSHEEPAVRHALLALSSLYEAYDLQGTIELRNLHATGTDTAEPARFALQQYTKAVGLLSTQQPIGMSPTSLQGVLIACVLFVWIEFLQNNLDTALKHLQGGLQIWIDLQQKQQANTSRIDASLPRILRRLHASARMHGSPTSDYNSKVSEHIFDLGCTMPTAFDHVSEARQWLDTVLDPIFRFFRRMYSPEYVVQMSKRHPHPDPLSLESTVEYHLENLHRWHMALVSGPIHATSTPNHLILALHYTSVTIMLKTLLAQSEMAYDQYAPSFSHILKLASRILSMSGSGLPVPKVSFDIGVIGPLFHLLLKCRYLPLRQRALELLKQAPVREGIWHRDSLAEFAQWKISLEEQARGNVPLSDPLPAVARIHSERARQVLLDGKMVTVFMFKRGDAMDRTGELEFETQITGLSVSLGEMV